MRFATIDRDGYTEPALISDGQVVALRDAGFESVLHIIAGGSEALDGVQRWAGRTPGSSLFDPAAVKLRAPILRPPKIICIGLNYRDHAAEAGLPIPETPVVFSKYATAVIGPGEPIILPRNSAKPDYEAELAIVIGRGGRYIRAEDWRAHVFGYTIINDVSARDYQMTTSQWMIGKTFDTFAPIGPAIVTADEIPDPHNLRISLTLSGEVMQDSNTCNLIFQTPQLIEFLSGVFTLEPGDIIATGTPPGVGFAHKPPRWLKPGDEVRIAIEGVGELVNPVVAEEPA